MKTFDYREIDKMTKEELIEYMKKPYITKNGIIVEREFAKNGATLTTLWGEYLRKKLEGI